jgi:hypothetical protein
VAHADRRLAFVDADAEEVELNCVRSLLSPAGMSALMPKRLWRMLMIDCPSPP